MKGDDDHTDPAWELRPELVLIGDGDRNRRDGRRNAANPDTRNARVLPGGLGVHHRAAGDPRRRGDRTVVPAPDGGPQPRTQHTDGPLLRSGADGPANG